jgi:hypothetical protein
LPIARREGIIPAIEGQLNEKKGTKMDFTKPKDGTFTIAPQYLFDYLLKYSFNKHYKINPVYGPKLVPELEYDNYGRTDEEKFFLVANEKVCSPTTTGYLYECMKKYPTMRVSTHNVRDFMEYLTGGFDIWTGEYGAPNYLEGMRRTLEDSAHTFTTLFLKSQLGPIMERAIDNIEANRRQGSAEDDGLVDKIMKKYEFPPLLRFSGKDILGDFRQLWICKGATVNFWNRQYQEMCERHNSEALEFATHFNSYESKIVKSDIDMNIRDIFLDKHR